VSRARVGVLAAVALASGCDPFSPSFDNLQCSPEGECPDGLSCVAGTCRPETCGDGFIVGAEVCDDGNGDDGDGCDATCTSAACFVPVTHATVAAGLADPACATLDVYAGTYAERITVSRDVTIAGVGAEPVVLDGGAGGSVVTIREGVTATLRGFTIRNGRAPAGGGILNRGDLTLDAMTIRENVAVAEQPAGGGISNAGTLTLRGTIVTRSSLTSTATARSVIPILISLSGAGIHSTAGVVRLSQASLVEANEIIVTGLPGASGQGAGIGAQNTRVQISGASSVRNNTLDINGLSGGASASGAGLWLSGGVLELDTGSAIEDNVATARGAVGEARGVVAQGGGFYASSTLITINAAFVRNNQVVALDEQGATATAGGGHVNEGSVTVTAAAITGNSVRAQGGGTASTGGLHLETPLSVSITDSQLSANRVSTGPESLLPTVSTAQAEVGALFLTSRLSQTFTILRCTFDGNTVTSPGGNAQYGALQVAQLPGTEDVLTVNIVQTTLSNNRVSGETAQVGALAATSGNGTGIALDVNVVQTTLSNNLVSGVSWAQIGAALAHAVTGQTTINLNFVNSTVSGNRVDAPMGTAGEGAITGSTGGGSAKVHVNLASSTVTANGATSKPGVSSRYGGLYLRTGTSPSMASASLKNSIIAGNLAATDPDCKSEGASITSGGYNLIGDAGTCTFDGDVTGHLSGAAGLGPLGDHGGPTQTHALLSGSRAIDAGNPAKCTDLVGVKLTTDQRGKERNNRCDIGAFER
jgi:cysteine-rich repeat protein